jgi:glutathione S-transferase
VLVVDGTAIAGSARILDEIERRWPSPPLTPADAALAQSAREIERRFDEDFTPRVRRPMLDAMLTDLGYVARTFGGGLVYRAALPMAKGLIRKGNGIDAPGALEDGRKAIGESLDFVAAGTARTGYLVGNAFTRADLTAAASLATLCAPDHPDMRRPEPMPAVLAKMVEEVAGHPAIAWTLDIYRRHRPAPLAA